MKLTNGIVVVAGIAVAAMSVFSAAASQVIVNPAIDAFVTSGTNNTLVADNFGGAGALGVAASGLGNGEFQTVMQFNLAGAKSSFDTQFGTGQWAIQSVTLQLTSTPPNNPIFNPTAAGSFNVSLMLNNSWTEGTGTPAAPTTTGITFNSLPGFTSGSDEALGTFSFNGSTSGASTYTLTLSSDLTSDIINGSTASLRLFANDSVVSYLFNSRSGGSGTAHPELIINAVPEPGVMGLGAMGFSVIYFWRRASRPRG
jgi:hypothetical protein